MSAESVVILSLYKWGINDLPNKGPGQVGQLAEGHVDLERRALVGDAPHRGTERLRQRLGREQAQERHVGVRVARDHRRARLEAVHVSVPAAVMQTHVAGLPAGVALGPGRIEVRFASVPEALQQLFTLAQAITNDYDRFAAIVSAPASSGGGESTV